MIMKIGKVSMVILCCITIFFSYNQKTKAAFEIASTTASYDSNTGLLTLQDPMFSKVDYQNRFIAYADMMRLGDVVLSGSAEFSNSTMRLYVTNKNVVNQQAQFTRTQTVANGFNLQKGAIVHAYKPPNSINVELHSESNARVLSVNVVGLRPVMKINTFTSDLSTIHGEESVFLSVSGENLHVSTFAVYAHYTGVTHAMSVSSASAQVRVNVPANTSGSNRTDTYTLYVNGQDSMKKVSVIVQAKEAPPIEKPQEILPPTGEGADPEDEANENMPNKDTIASGSDKEDQSTVNPSTPSANIDHTPNTSTPEAEDKGIAQAFKEVLAEKTDIINIPEASIEESITEKTVPKISEDKLGKDEVASFSLLEEKDYTWLIIVIVVPLLSCFVYIIWKMYKK